jgi:hypothetical protein
MTNFMKGGRGYPRIDPEAINQKMKDLGGLKSRNLVEMKHVGAVRIGSVIYHKQHGWEVRNSQGNKINILNIVRVIER